MEYPLNPKIVLSYLNELGYTNINAHQLKEFMIDLKKLIKYHDRECSEAENLNPKFTYHPPPSTRDVFEDLYNTETEASKAKKTSVITVEIKKPKKVAKKDSTQEVQRQKESVEVQTSPCLTIPPIKPPSPEFRSESCTCTLPATARTISTDRKTQTKRPKTSFIRPRLNTKPPKSDPVALFHQYQEEWKRVKIPGQDNHADLRWAIRSKMLGGEKYDYCY